MYQQYVNEARAAQYQQQCLCEAAIERSLPRHGAPALALRAAGVIALAMVRTLAERCRRVPSLARSH